MRRSNYLAVLLIFMGAIFMAACEDDIAPVSDKLVIEAYLFANEPVTEIRISRLSSFGSNIQGDPINDAFVVLASSRRDIQLLPTEGRPGYYHSPIENFVPTPNEEFGLLIFYKNDTMHAITKVPPRPLELEANKEILMIDTAALTDNAQDSIDVQWASPGLYSTVVSPINPNQELIIDQAGDINILNEPIMSKKYSLTKEDVDYYGINTFTLYRVNGEYARLFQVNSSSFFITNGNIHNGYGIFTAFNSDSFDFEVAKK